MNTFLQELPRVEITARVFSRRFGKSEDSFERRFQQGYFCTVDEWGGEERFSVKVPLEHDQAPYVPGLYAIRGSNFTTGKYGDLELKRFHLDVCVIPESLIKQQATTLKAA